MFRYSQPKGHDSSNIKFPVVKEPKDLVSVTYPQWKKQTREHIHGLDVHKFEFRKFDIRPPTRNFGSIPKPFETHPRMKIQEKFKQMHFDLSHIHNDNSYNEKVLRGLPDISPKLKEYYSRNDAKNALKMEGVVSANEYRKMRYLREGNGISAEVPMEPEDFLTDFAEFLKLAESQPPSPPVSTPTTTPHSSPKIVLESIKDTIPITEDDKKMKPVKSGDYESESDDEEGKAAKDFVKSNYKDDVDLDDIQEKEYKKVFDEMKNTDKLYYIKSRLFDDNKTTQEQIHMLLKYTTDSDLTEILNDEQIKIKDLEKLAEMFLKFPVDYDLGKQKRTMIRRILRKVNEDKEIWKIV